MNLIHSSRIEFLAAFSDAQFLDVIKMIFTDPYIDKRVQKRLSTILLAWQEQHKDDPSMAPFAGLYAQFKKDKHLFKDDDLMTYLGHPNEYQEPKKKVKEEKTKTRERKRRRSFNLERVGEYYWGGTTKIDDSGRIKPKSQTALLRPHKRLVI